MLLLAVYARQITIVRTPAEMFAIKNNSFGYVAESLNLSPDSRYALTGLDLRCKNRTLNVRKSYFSTLENSQISDCTLQLSACFAERLLNVTFRRVRIVQYSTAPPISEITQCAFEGVFIDTKDIFGVLVSDSVFGGCAMRLQQMDPEELRNRTEFAIFEELRRVVVQNCNIVLQACAHNATNISALVCNASFVSVYNSRVIAEVDLLYYERIYTMFGSLATRLIGDVTIKNTDSVVKITGSSMVSEIGGFVGYIYVGELEISNSSVSFSIEDFEALGASNVDVRSVIAGITGSAGANTELNGVSAYLDVDIQKVDIHGVIEIAGIVGRQEGNGTKLTQCYVVGSINAEIVNTSSCYVAGALGVTEGSAGIYQIAVHAQVTVNVENYTYVFVSGVVAHTNNATMAKCIFDGNLSAELAQKRQARIGGVLGNTSSLGNSDEFSELRCTANISVVFTAQHTSSQVGGVAATTAALVNSIAECNLSVNEREESLNASISLLVAYSPELIANCSVSGIIELVLAQSYAHVGVAHPVLASAAANQYYDNITVYARLLIPAYLTNISSAFYRVSKCTFTNILVSVELSGPQNVSFATSVLTACNYVNVLIDCLKEGNNPAQTQCAGDLAKIELSDEVLVHFDRNYNLNSGLPYFKYLPVASNAGKYVLPASGAFSSQYFVDAAGQLFFSVEYPICRGACFGVYNSTVSETCDENTSNCVDSERAKMEFPVQSCFLDNAVCEGEVSFCKTDSLLLKINPEYACNKSCDGCLHGYCSGSGCICDEYFMGSGCDEYRCDADEPVCYGDVGLLCTPDNSRCALPCESIEGCTACDTANQTLCASCESGMITAANKQRCVCGTDAFCSAKEYCSSGVCAASCESIADCIRCAVPDFSMCAACDKQLTPTLDGRKCRCGGEICGSNEFCRNDVCQTTCKVIDNCIECDGGYPERCKICNDGLKPNNDEKSCVCGELEVTCDSVSYCANGTCILKCTASIENCETCAAANQSLCAQCTSGYELDGGVCKAKPKNGPLIGIIAGASAAVVLAIVVIVASACVCKRKKAARSSMVLPELTRTTIKEIEKESPKVLTAMPPIQPAGNNPAARRVKKIVRNDEIGEPLLQTAMLNSVSRAIRLEPLKQSDKDGLV